MNEVPAKYIKIFIMNIERVENSLTDVLKVLKPPVDNVVSEWLKASKIFKPE